MTHRMDMNDLCDRIMNERSAPRALDDSDRNILASLAHEPCEAHCVDCGGCVPYGDAYITINEDNYCQECAS